MEESQLDRIYGISEKRVNDVSLNIKRFIDSQIDWNHRLIGIRGARGVGKTTLLLQHIKESEVREKLLYVSLDSIWLTARELYDVVQHHVQHGGIAVYLDEVHYMDNWQTLIKNLNDDFKGLQIAYTGSSLLRLESKGGDLSRRQLIYHLPGLSFREYLNFEGLGDFPVIPLETLLTDHLSYAHDILEKLTIILPHFETYLRLGYYPFYQEAGSHFNELLKQAINQVLDSDYPQIDDVLPATIHKARRMLKILAETAPQTPNVTQLCRELEMDRKQGLKMLYALDRAGLLQLLQSDRENLKNLSSPEKIYCGDTNIMYSFVEAPDKGTLRETFFMNQLSMANTVTYPRQGDFLVNDKWLFEVGGAGKTFKQIKDIPDSYLAIDDLEIGRGHRIPLWMFGFLY